jgi:hypothetical protein
MSKVSTPQIKWFRKKSFHKYVLFLIEFENISWLNSYSCISH